MLIDTHCHLHDLEFYPDNREAVYAESIEAGVTMVCVGTDVSSSLAAVDFVATHPKCWAVVGIHPHEAATANVAAIEDILKANHARVVGVGEIGLDYYYTNSPREQQRRVLREQLALAVKYRLPVSFHVRDAYDDFWPIFREFKGVKGVLHSFTDTKENAQIALSHGLYIGVNGISTFTKDKQQQQLYRELPLASIVLETDAPFLTPAPFRGKMNKPAYVGRVAEHQAALKQVSVSHVVRTTTHNAKVLYRIP
ncbi:MAG: TatD family hydrolase [Candidatus Saccharimonas sp.]